MTRHPESLQAKRSDAAGNGGQAGTFVPPALVALERRLLAAWRTDDQATSDEEWTTLWSWLFPMALKFSHKQCGDEQMARSWATDAIADAWVDINRLLKAGEGPGDGDGDFVRWILARVILCCRRQARAGFSWLNRLADGHADDDRDEGGVAGATVAPVQEQNLLHDCRDRDGLWRLVEELAALRRQCEAYPVLAALVEQIQAYMADCLAATTPDAAAAGADDLNHLVAIALIDAIEVDKSSLLRFLRARLPNPERLSFRLHRLRDLYRGRTIDAEQPEEAATARGARATPDR